MTTQPIIEVDLRLAVADASRRFDLAVRFVSEAPVVALYGPSGAGKTLTLQAIAGLQRPDAGHVRIAGRTLFDSTQRIDLPASERQVGYLFQHYALFPHLPVHDNVAFGLTSWRRRRLDARQQQRVEELLESLQLTEVARARPADLSGGQQQRVALARALACEPRVLLLDEPFAALNTSLRASLREELKLLRQQFDVPMVMVTHDLADVSVLADEVVVIEQGEVQRCISLRDAHARQRAIRSLDPAL